MGILDFPAPVFSFLDQLIAFLPSIVRLGLWGALGGVLSMLFYSLISPQDRLSEVKVALREAQGQLASSDDSFDELMQLVKKTLSLSLKHLSLVLFPALVSSLPLVCILAWSSTHFGYQFPEPGEQLSVNVQPESAATQVGWRLDGVALPELSASQIEWPGPNQILQLHDRGADVLLTLPAAAAIPQIHKKLWWNNLLGNPAGYLPDNSPVDLVAISLPPQRHLAVGPVWLGDWMVLFIIAALVAALLVKWQFKIH
ncbi:MAG: hypothetical protein ACI9JM_000430 [Halioglobus sp.]|jgi:hypothetical protein